MNASRLTWSYNYVFSDDEEDGMYIAAELIIYIPYSLSSYWNFPKRVTKTENSQIINLVLPISHSVWLYCLNELYPVHLSHDFKHQLSEVS